MEQPTPAAPEPERTFELEAETTPERPAETELAAATTPVPEAETTPVPEAEADDPEPAPTASGRRAATLTLAIAAAVLAVSTAFLSVVYVNARTDLSARDRALATQTAERDRLRQELDAVIARRTELEGKLAAAEAKMLDPAGYELIKKCVHEYADMEREIRKAIASGGGVFTTTTLRPVIVDLKGVQIPTDCADAEPYLK